MSKKEPKQEPSLVFRLTPEAFEQVQKLCKPVDIGTQTTELQAAFILGQQSVLKFIRENIVVGA